jgi:hypothetical protein
LIFPDKNCPTKDASLVKKSRITPFRRKSGGKTTERGDSTAETDSTINHQRIKYKPNSI